MSSVESQSKKINKRAYVFLVMMGDDYIPGVICAVESLKVTKTPYDFVCMVTVDVSSIARDLLTKNDIRVVEVPLLRYASKDMKTKRQTELYETWFNESYTKWNCLNLVEYEKILFIDADIVVLQNIDHLFNLQAPAATFSNPWATEFSYSGKYSVHGYPTEHGHKVDNAVVVRALYNEGYTFIASLVLLEPSEKKFAELIALIISKQMFKFDCYSTPDEQSLAYLYASGNNNSKHWTHIHQKYNFIVHKVDWLKQDNKIQIPHVLHYFSAKKPWLMRSSVSESLYNTDRIWWRILQRWHLRTKMTLDIPQFAATMEETLRIRYTKIDVEFFPWITSMRAKFPEMFIKPPVETPNQICDPTVSG